MPRRGCARRTRRAGHDRTGPASSCSGWRCSEAARRGRRPGAASSRRPRRHCWSARRRTSSTSTGSWEVPERERAERLHEINAELAGLGDDPEVLRLLARSLLMEADCHAHRSAGVALLVDRARAIEEVVTPTLVMDRVDCLLADVAIIADRHDEARRLLRDLIATSEELGDDLSLPDAAGPAVLAGGPRGQLGPVRRAACERRRPWPPASTSTGRTRPGSAWPRPAACAGTSTAPSPSSTRASRRPRSRCRRTRSPRGGRAGRRSSWPAAGSRRPTSTSLRAQEEAAGTVVEEPGILQADAPFMDCAIALGRLDEAAEHLRFVVDWTRRVDNPSVRRRVLADRGAAGGRPRRPRRGGAHDP